MTFRSSKHTPPKSTTTARKQRNRTDQNLSIQPPELPQLKDLRPHRANTLPGVQPVHRSNDTHTPTWGPEGSTAVTRSNTSHPGGFVQDPHSGALIAQSLANPHYLSFRDSHSIVPPASSGSSSSEYPVRATPESELLQSPLPSLSGSHTATEFDLRISAEPEPPHDPFFKPQDMSTLGFMMAPAPYGMEHYGSPHHLDSPSYPPIESPYPEPKPTSSATYPPTYASSQNVSSQNASPRSVEQPQSLPSYQASAMTRSPYQQSMAPVRSSASTMTYPMTSSEAPPLPSSAPQHYPYPALHGLPPAPLASHSASYPPPPLYPSTSYGMSDYTPLPTTLYPSTTSPAHYSPYEQQQAPSLAQPTTSPVAGISSNQPQQPSGVMPRILNSRPKPQCWEHGCNGRQFSTFSNLLRHQREKSGTAAKSTCPRCGAEFTRTTARNGHMAHEKCKPRRTSDTHR